MPETLCASLANFVDLLLDAICIVDKEGRYVQVSAAYEQIFGYTPDEVIGRYMIDLVHPDDRERTLQAANNVMAGRSHLHFENRYIRKDGRVVHIMWSARWSEVDQLRIAVARDITERKRADMLQTAVYAISEAAHTAGDLPTLFRHIHEFIGQLLPATNFFVAFSEKPDNQLTFPYGTGNLAENTRHHLAALNAFSRAVIDREQPILLNIESATTLPPHLAPLQSSSPGCWLGVPLSFQSGTAGALILKGNTGDCPYTADDQELLQYISTQVAAAIERKKLLEQLQHLAENDELTGLPNRRQFFHCLESAIDRARQTGELLAVLYLDLDNFKPINDNFGHAAGDLVLQEIARRLRQTVRDTDTVSRIGGDEFVIILHPIKEPANAAVIAEKIRAVISAPISLSSQPVTVSPSIGIALYPHHGSEPLQLLKHADDAMYQSKTCRLTPVPT